MAVCNRCLLGFCVSCAVKVEIFKIWTRLVDLKEFPIACSTISNYSGRYIWSALKGLRGRKVVRGCASYLPRNEDTNNNTIDNKSNRLNNDLLQENSTLQLHNCMRCDDRQIFIMNNENM